MRRLKRETFRVILCSGLQATTTHPLISITLHVCSFALLLKHNHPLSIDFLSLCLFYRRAFSFSSSLYHKRRGACRSRRWVVVLKN